MFWERPCSSRGRERGILAALPRSLVRAVTAPSDHPASPLHGVMRNLGDSLRKRVEMGSDVVTRVRSSTKPGVRIGQGQTIHPSAAPDAVRRRHATDGVDLGGRASPELSLPQTRRRRWLAAQDRGWRCLGHSAVAPSTHRVARPPPTPCKGAASSTSELPPRCAASTYADHLRCHDIPLTAEVAGQAGGGRSIRVA